MLQTLVWGGGVVNIPVIFLILLVARALLRIDSEVEAGLPGSGLTYPLDKKSTAA
jgi:hypothetical protein